MRVTSYKLCLVDGKLRNSMRKVPSLKALAASRFPGMTTQLENPPQRTSLQEKWSQRNPLQRQPSDEHRALFIESHSCQGLSTVLWSVHLVTNQPISPWIKKRPSFSCLRVNGKRRISGTTFEEHKQQSACWLPPHSIDAWIAVHYATLTCPRTVLDASSQRHKEANPWTSTLAWTKARIPMTMNSSRYCPAISLQEPSASHSIALNVPSESGRHTFQWNFPLRW
jgi:hypothetical protein